MWQTELKGLFLDELKDIFSAQTQLVKALWGNDSAVRRQRDNSARASNHAILFGLDGSLLDSNYEHVLA